ncbi:MAG: c-type cytochrome [Alphaproteobacteria bacterium]|nr:c-type cytochrome [Alphaproteobacteria bacterium]
MARSGWLLGPALLLCLGLPVRAQEDHAYTAEQIQGGYRLYASQCQLCHGLNGDGVAGTSLSRQQFRFVTTDADIRRMVTNGSTGGGMPPFSLKDEEVDGLIAFIRSGMDRTGISFRLGDAARGKIVYDRSGCAACHRIAGQGARIGPNLTDIGFLRRPGQIFTSLTEPIKATMPINRPVMIVLKNGRTIKGRRYDEDTFFVRLIDSDERLVSVSKGDIRSYQVRMDTDMPSFRGRLSDGELGDLVAYLTTLKG